MKSYCTKQKLNVSFCSNEAKISWNEKKGILARGGGGLKQNIVGGKIYGVLCAQWCKFSVAIKREANYSATVTLHGSIYSVASVFYTRVSLMAMGQFGNRVAEFSPSMMER